MAEKEIEYRSPLEILTHQQSNDQRLFKKAFDIHATPDVKVIIERADFQIQAQEYDSAYRTLKLTHSPNLLVIDTYIKLSTIKIGEGNTDGALLLLNEAAVLVKKNFASNPHDIDSQLALRSVVEGFAKMGELDTILSFFDKINKYIDYEDEISFAAQDLAENGHTEQAIQAVSFLAEDEKASAMRIIDNIVLGRNDSELIKIFRNRYDSSDNARLCALLADSEKAFEQGDAENAKSLLTLFTKEYSPSRFDIGTNSKKEFVNFAVGEMGEANLGLEFLNKFKPDIELIYAYCDVAKAQFFSGDIDGARETVNLSKAKLGKMQENKYLEPYKFDAELDIIATQIEIGEKNKAFDRLDQLAPELVKEDLYDLIGGLYDRGNIDLIPFLINLSKEPMTNERVILTRNLINAGRMSEAKEQLEVIYSDFSSTIDKCAAEINQGGSGMITTSFVYSELSAIHQKLGDITKAQEMVGYHHEFVRSQRGVISEEGYKEAMWKVLRNSLVYDDYENTKQIAFEFQSGADRSELYNYLARRLEGENAITMLKRAEEEADNIDDGQATEKSSAYLSISNSYYKIDKINEIGFMRTI